MAQATGKSSISGTGSKTLLTALTGAPTWATIASASGQNFAFGQTDGTKQNCVTTGPTSAVDGTKFISLVNSSGTVIFEATFTSFGTSAGSGTITFNVTTNSGVTPIVCTVGN